MQRVAIIDLGSNTSKLVVFECEPGYRYRQVDELRQVVRLGEGMSEANILRADAIDRGLYALDTFHAYCRAADIDHVYATATSAVRDAKNGDSFLAAVRQKIGLELRILSGDEEAYFGALAVANSLTFNDAFVIDIGGGSAQLSHLVDRRYEKGVSWPIGAVRMTERFLTSDPPKKKEVKALVAFVQEQLGDYPEGFAADAPLVGMGGTIRNLAKIQKKDEDYPVDLLNSYVLAKDDLDDIVEDLLDASISERRDISGLKTDRADIIAAGAVVAQELLRRSGSSGITISSQGLREGLFYNHFVAADPPLIENVREFSVQNMARNYYDNPKHNEHVRTLSLMLFDQLEPLHNYSSFERDVLSAAAIVHDIGMAVNYNDHHKHGFYLLMETSLAGYSHREHALIALLVRYHRKGSPSSEGIDDVLEDGDMTRVNKLAALLRIAEYLERSKAQRVRELICHVSDNYVQIEVVADGGLQVEIHEANLRKYLFESAYDATLEIVASQSNPS